MNEEQVTISVDLLRRLVVTADWYERMLPYTWCSTCRAQTLHEDYWDRPNEVEHREGCILVEVCKHIGIDVPSP